MSLEESNEEDRREVASTIAVESFDDSPLTQLRTFWNAVSAGVCSAALVTLVMTAIETWAFARSQLRSLDETGFRWDLLMWGVGKSALGNLFVLGACGVLIGGLVWVLRRALQRRRSRRADPRPLLATDALTLPALVVVAGFTLLPFTLPQLGWSGELPRTLGWLAALILALGVSVAARKILPPGEGRPRPRWAMAAACAAVLLVPLVLFWRSPYFDPAGYSSLGQAESAQRIRRTNVVWVVLDTTSAQRMSLYGHDRETTPFLERLAETDSIVFERAASNGMWTVPSHSSMFTGLPLRAHGAGYPDRWLAPEFPTVAGILADQGWQTRAVVGNTWLSRTTDIVRGFEQNTNIYKLHTSFMTAAQKLFDTRVSVPPFSWLDYGSRAAITNREVARWLDSRAQSFDPFFLFVNYMDAHLVYQAPLEYRRRFMTEDEVARSYEISKRTYGSLTEVLFMDYDILGEHVVVEEDRDILARLYDASIAHLDDRIEELVELFEERDLLEDTLLVITADHGEYVGAHGMWSHHFLAYDGVAHVPLIIRPPGGTPAKRVETQVQLSDLFETVLNATLGEGQVPVGPFSEDLLELARADAPRSRFVVTEFETPDERAVTMISNRGQEGIEHYAVPQTAVRDGRYLYLESEAGLRELYDLVADPQESRNLIDSEPEIAERLAGYLAQWRERTPIYTPSEDRDRSELSEDDLDALRALGYVG